MFDLDDAMSAASGVIFSPYQSNENIQNRSIQHQISMQNIKNPYGIENYFRSPLTIAREQAAAVRAAHPEMQVKRITKD